MDPKKESEHLSITGVVEHIRADSDSQDPVLREVEVAAMIRLCNLLDRTGIVRVPGIVYGGLLAELDRVEKLSSQAAEALRFGGLGGATG